MMIANTICFAQTTHYAGSVLNQLTLPKTKGSTFAWCLTSKLTWAYIVLVTTTFRPVTVMIVATATACYFHDEGGVLLLLVLLMVIFRLLTLL